MNHLADMIPPTSRLWVVLERLLIIPVLLILGAFGLVLYWALDREPPLKVVSYQTWPVKPNGVLHVAAEVTRDLSRECHVVLSSSIVDSSGVRWDLGTTQSVNPAGVRELEARSPGKILRKIQLPPGLTPGPAAVLSSMTYRCNPLHDLVRPISVQARFNFEVLP